MPEPPSDSVLSRSIGADRANDPPLISDPIPPDRAVRLLRAKVGELERQVKLHADRGDDRYWMLADIALVADILAEYIEWSQEWSGRDAE